MTDAERQRKKRERDSALKSGAFEMPLFEQAKQDLNAMIFPDYKGLLALPKYNNALSPTEIQKLSAQ